MVCVSVACNPALFFVAGRRSGGLLQKHDDRHAFRTSTRPLMLRNEGNLSLSFSGGNRAQNVHADFLCRTA